MIDTYLKDPIHSRLVDSIIAALVRCPVAGTDLRSAIVEALGEIGGIWPASISENNSLQTS